MRTMALIAAGACLFAGIGLMPFSSHNVDPTRIAAQIVTGVGFLGAGAILRQGEAVKGLTTAASIWVVASLGMAVGFGYYVVAIISVVVVLVTLAGLRPIEVRLFKRPRNRRHDDPRAEGGPPE